MRQPPAPAWHQNPPRRGSLTGVLGPPVPPISRRERHALLGRIGGFVTAAPRRAFWRGREQRPKKIMRFYSTDRPTHQARTRSGIDRPTPLMLLEVSRQGPTDRPLSWPVLSRSSRPGPTDRPTHHPADRPSIRPDRCMPGRPRPTDRPRGLGGTHRPVFTFAPPYSPGPRQLDSGISATLGASNGAGRRA